MTAFRKTVAPVLMLLGTPLSVPSAVAELITNGGFETGDLTGWTCTADSCIADTGSLSPNSGNWYTEAFDNTGVGELSQSFSTVIGEDYLLSFFSTVLTVDPANILRYEVTGLAPVLVEDTSNWLNTMQSFTASSTTTVVNFLIETNSGTGIWGIDDVSVTIDAADVPAPTTLALSLVGLLGLARFGLRKTLSRSRPMAG